MNASLAKYAGSGMARDAFRVGDIGRFYRFL